MVTKCIVPDCGNSCNSKLSVTLFSFPKDLKLAKTWLELTRARRIKDIKSHHKVCSKHFEERYIVNHFGATRLAPGAIPTLFEWNFKKFQTTGTFEGTFENNDSFITIQKIGNAYSPASGRCLLPSKSLPVIPTPKVRIPPLVKRYHRSHYEETPVTLSNRKTPSCDVILPNAGSSHSDRMPIIVSATSCYESYESPQHQEEENNQSLFASDDDRDSSASEFVLGEIGEYTLSTKKLKPDVVGDEDVDDPLAALPIKLGLDDESHQPFSGDCIEGMNFSGNTFIEEIVEDLQEEIDDNLVPRQNDIEASGEEIIIEECSIIEDEIIPPENVDIPLSPSFFHNDETLRHVADDSKRNPDLDIVTNDVIKKMPISSATSTTSNVVLLKKTDSPNKSSSGSQINTPPIARRTKQRKQPRVTNKGKVIKSGPPSTAKKVSNNSTPRSSRITKKQSLLAAKQTPASSNLRTSSIQLPSTTTTATNPVNIVPRVPPAPVATYLIPQSGCPASLLPTMTFTNSNNQSFQLNSSIGGVNTQPAMASFLIATAPSTPIIAAPSNINSSKPAVAPMVYQVGNMVLPVASPFMKTTPMAVQNNVNLVGPPMTFLIPVGGSLPQPLAVQSSTNSDTDKLLISRSKPNAIIPPVQTANSKDGSIPNRRQRVQKKILNTKDKETPGSKKVSLNDGNEKSRPSASSTGLAERRKREAPVKELKFYRLFQKFKAMKIALKKKDLTVKKLEKEKHCLSSKLKILRGALAKLRKATILSLSSTKILEKAEDCELASATNLLLKETKDQGK